MTAYKEMTFEGVTGWIDREHRNSPKYQWARELLQNGMEAGAHRIRFDVEWQGVRHGHTYRLLYSDDGCGMSAKELSTYMATLGKGGKSVGGAHDNFAVGVRMTLLPWNKAGIVVISLKDGDTNMIKMMHDPESNRYVLQEFDQPDGTSSEVTEPYHDRVLGIDFNRCVPDYIRKAGHGTVFILFGDDLTQDTILGDQNKGEDGQEGIVVYLNSRYWTLPDDVNADVVIFGYKEKAKWPKQQPGPHIPRNPFTERSIVSSARLRGRRHYLTTRNDEPLSIESGVLHCDDADIHYFMSPSVDDASYDERYLRSRVIGNSISLLYRNETYALATTTNSRDVASVSGNKAVAIYNQFGVNATKVRNRVTILIEPREYDPASSKKGVSPNTSRGDLYWNGTGEISAVVRLEDFAEEFAANLPQCISDAVMAELMVTNDDKDKLREARLRDSFSRYMDRWQTKVNMTNSKGNLRTKPYQGVTEKPASVRRGNASIAKRKAKHDLLRKIARVATQLAGDIDPDGKNRASIKKADGGVPSTTWVTEDEMQQSYYAVQYDGPSSAFPNGIVKMNQDHPLFVDQIEYWCNSYLTDNSDAVRRELVHTTITSRVREVYEDSVLSRIGHLDNQRGNMFPDEAVQEMLSPEALTSSVMGLLMEDTVLGQRLASLGKRNTGTRRRK